jgi:hypothetical protein
MSYVSPDRDQPPPTALPDVKPPTAGFLIQLFVVPALIVLIIVSIWLAIKWLTMDAGDPHKYLEQIRTSSRNRWNVALQLATALADPRYDSIKLDGAYMQGLADVLGEELDRPSEPKDPMLIRVYLCRALAQFRVSDGLPVLIRVANQQRDAASIEGRIAAVEAIGRLAENIRGTLAGKLLPQAVKTTRQLADQLAAAPSGSPGAEKVDQLRAAAATAEELADTARTRADFASRCADFSRRLTDLADRVPADSQGPLRELSAAIARQAAHAAKIEAPNGSQILRALVDAVNEASPALQFDDRFDKEIDRAPMLHEVAAISLGLVGGPDALARLEEIVVRQRGLLRYNAAVGLCRAGRATPDVLDALNEMLTEPDVKYDEPAQPLTEFDRRQREEAGRQQMALFALEAVRLLAEANPDADLSTLKPPLDRIAQNDPDPKLRIEAAQRLSQIANRGSKSKP